MKSVKKIFCITLLSVFPTLGLYAQMFGGHIFSQDNASAEIPTGRMYFIGSVYDKDIYPYNIPTTPAAIGSLAGDGTADTYTANYQGTIPTVATKLAIKIPMTISIGTSGIIPAYSNTQAVLGTFAEDGNGRSITLGWDKQSYDSNTKTINAYIYSNGGNFLAKKLDVNNGNGPDQLGLLICTFTIPNYIGETTPQGTYELRISPGIPDPAMYKPDANGNRNTHCFLYLPVQAEDGRIWLSSNLGASPFNMTGGTFNLNYQPTAYNDYRSYGSLYVAGNLSDSHELMTWTSSTTGSRTYSNIPLSPKSNGSAAWKATNGPCPLGFHVPKLYDMYNWIESANRPTSRVEAFNSILKFTAAGYGAKVTPHDSFGNPTGPSYFTLSSIGAESDYWTQAVDIEANPTFSNKSSHGVYFGATHLTAGAIMSFGHPFDSETTASVRCIKD